MLVGVLAVLWARSLVESAASHDRGERAEQSGDLEAAILHHRRATAWYAPINPWGDASLDRLVQIGDEALAAGRRPLALAAYRSAHGALASGRHVFTLHSAALRDVDSRLVRAIDGETLPVPMARLGPDARTAHLEQSLASVPEAGFVGSCVAIAGFAAVLAAVARATGGRPVGRGGTAAIVLGTVAFVVGLLLA